MLLLFIIILLFLNVIFTFLFCFPLFRYIRYTKKYKKSAEELSKLGCNISIDGLQGMGKTTTLHGIVEYDVQNLQSEIDKRLYEIKMKLKEVDFYRLNNFIYNYFDTHPQITKFNKFINFEDFEKYVSDIYCSESFYTDYIKIESKKELLIKYIIYFYVLNIRGILILSKSYLYSRALGKAAIYYDSSSIELKNVLTKYNFQLELGCIIIEDERNLFDGNYKSNSKEIKTSGATAFYCLIRNMGQGLVYRRLAKQDSENEVKQHRVLVANNCLIVDRDDNISFFKNFKFIIKLPIILLRVFVNFVNFFKKIFYRMFFKISFIEFDDIMSNKITLIRKIDSLLYSVDEKFFSFNCIKTVFNVYYSAEHVGKKSKEYYYTMTLYFPVTNCYNCDTYEYSDLLFYFEKFSSLSEKSVVSLYNSNYKINTFVKRLNDER